MSLQYFHFETPQRVKVHVDGTTYDRVALGYWQNVDEPSLEPKFNIADGEMNGTGWNAYIPSEVQS
jgi:hypothetical protein